MAGSHHQGVYHVYEITTDDEDIQTPEPPPVYVNEPEFPEDIGFWRGRRTNMSAIDVDNPQQVPANEYHGIKPITQDHRNRHAPDEQEDSSAVFHEYAFGKAHVIDLEKAEWNNPMRRGVMIALFPNDNYKSAIADAVKPLSVPDDFHLTLVFLGKIGEDLFKGDEARLLDAMKGFAKIAPPVTGKISGIGKFTAQETSDAKDVIHLMYDSAVLPDFRHTLLKYLESSQVPYKRDHGFDPHMTLDYVDAGKSVRLPNIPLYSMGFSSIFLAIGGQRYEFELEGSPDNFVKSLNKSHSRSECMKCSKPPQVEVLWAEGHGRAWFCNTHYGKWKKESSWHDVVSEKPVPDGEVGKRWADNRNKVKKAIFTARGKEENAKKAPSPQKNESKTTDMRGRVRYGYSASSGARHSNPNGNGEAQVEPPHPGDNLAETLGTITRTSAEDVKRLARRFEDSDHFARHFMSRHGALCKKHGIRQHHLHHIHDASVRKSDVLLVVDAKNAPDNHFLIDIEKADIDDLPEPDLADEENITDFDEEEVELGIRYELKFTDDAQAARRAVMSRLRSNPDYYSRMDRAGGQVEQVGQGNTMADQNLPVAK